MIGAELKKALKLKGHHVIILTRASGKKPAPSPNESFAHWDIEAQTIDREAIVSCDAIIHLAGAGIADKRWTKKRKAEIVNSRVRGGELLANALREYPNKVRTVVTASAIGWYGPDSINPNPHPFTENNPASNDFLGNACKQWEQSVDPVKAMGIRLVKIRTGVVMSRKGGALTEFRKPLLAGLATILGSGRQVISWIHIDDLIRIYIQAIEDSQLEGAYNAVVPFPVTNKQLVLTLARIKKGKFFITMNVPVWVLKMVLGELSIEVLKSATVSADKIKSLGFTFQFPTLEPALQNLEQ